MRWWSGTKRIWCTTAPPCRGWAAAAHLIARTASRESASGFSTSTCSPRRSAATMYSACVASGVQTATASRSGQKRSRSSTNSASLARASDALFVDDLERFWPDLDAVAVCTPDATHAEYIVAALRRGLHVLVEKPLADSRDAVRAIRCAAAAHPRQGGAGVPQMRFLPLHPRLKALPARDAGR